MLHVHDIRETPLFKEILDEAREEVLSEERQWTMQEKLRSVAKLAARQMPPAEIADVLGLDLEVVANTMRKTL